MSNLYNLDRASANEKADNIARMQAQIYLMNELSEGKKSGEEEGWISSDDVRNYFKARVNIK